MTPGTEKLMDAIDAARNAQAIDPLLRAATALYYRIGADTPAAEAIAIIRAELRSVYREGLRDGATGNDMEQAND